MNTMDDKNFKRTLNVTNKPIMGCKDANSLYLVNWSYCANFGYDLIRADSEEEAVIRHAYSSNAQVNFIVTKIDPTNLPVIAKGVSQ